MNQTRRQKIHEVTRQEIKDTAWQQIAETGAASLSLRAIARQMGLTAPALYRYYPDRDALVTALILDAFTSLRDALAQAALLHQFSGHARRYQEVGIAYRAWALAYPQRYTLIFGTPISGYIAPIETTLPAAASALGVLMQVLQDAWQDGALHLSPEYGQLPPGLSRQFPAWQQILDKNYPPEVLNLTLVSWCRVHGLVSLELYQALPPAITDPGALFNNEINALLRQAGLQISNPQE